VENRAGTEVGDWVVVPLTAGFFLEAILWSLCPAGGLSIGIVVGITVFKRISAGSRPFISKVIKTRLEMASMPVGAQ